MAFFKAIMVLLTIGSGYGAPQQLIRLATHGGTPSLIRAVPSTATLVNGHTNLIGLRAVPTTLTDTHQFHAEPSLFTAVRAIPATATTLVQRRQPVVTHHHVETPVVTRLRPVLTQNVVQPAVAVTNTRHHVVESAAPAPAAAIRTHHVVETAPAIATTHHVVEPSPLRTVIAATQPALTEVRTVEEEITRVDPSYNFGYSVNDAVSGDSKVREESSDGRVVTGSYSVAQPDGRIRQVKYTADAANGFQAEVSYDGQVNAPPAIPIENRETAAAAVIATAPATSAVIADDSNLDDVIITERRRVIANRNRNRGQQLVLVRGQQPQQQIISANPAATLVHLNNLQPLRATPFGLRTVPTGIIDSTAIHI